METKNQNTLYRFVSLRSPELTKKENQNNRFVFHPDQKTGVFFESLKTKNSDDTKWSVLQSTATNFVAFKNEIEIENINNQFYEVADWISRNKTSFDNQKLAKKIINLKPLDIKSELIFWDNLFYQVITEKSFYIKEAIIQILVLNNLLKQASGLKKQLVLFKELSNAHVILPLELFE